MINNTIEIPTHLFVGDDTTLYNTIVTKLQQAFCPNQIPPNNHCFCNECRKIKNNQHHAIVWIEPEKKYTLDDISIVFKKIQFSLEANQLFFFIFKKAHFLTQTCANKLLKTLEEPPHGYKFLLLTNNENAILPTIRSRCHIHYYTNQTTELFQHPLLNIFIDPEKLDDPISFEQKLKEQSPTEEESIELLHEFTKSIQKKLISAQKECSSQKDLNTLQTNKTYKELKIIHAFLQKQARMLPQPGGSLLFWKKFFITFPRKHMVL